MRPALRTAVVAAICAAIAGGAWWYVVRRDRRAYTLPERALEKWTLVTSDGTDSWVVGMKPPDTLVRSLLDEVSKRAGGTLHTPAHPAVPLVLRAEFDEGLQGVYGTDSILKFAREDGVESTTFTPVCLAHQRRETDGGVAEVYFVPFESEAFNRMRVDLMPAFPEQAGVGIYDPATLTPILIVAATDASFDRWWPMTVDRERDCEAPLAAAAGH